MAFTVVSVVAIGRQDLLRLPWDNDDGAPCLGPAGSRLRET